MNDAEAGKVKELGLDMMRACLRLERIAWGAGVLCAFCVGALIGGYLP